MIRTVKNIIGSLRHNGGLAMRRGLYYALDNVGVGACPTCGKVPRARWGADGISTTEVEVLCSSGCAVDLIVGSEYRLEDVVLVCQRLLAARAAYEDIVAAVIGEAIPRRRPAKGSRYVERA